MLKRFFNATMWSSIGVYVNRFLTLGIAAILSRLLTPEDFGIVAMVTVISGFMTIFAEAGIGSAVIQFRNFQIRDHQTLFTLSLALGIILSGLLALGSPFVAFFFKNPDVKLIAIVMSLAFPLSAIGLVPRGLLQRDMRFREIAFGNIMAAFIAGCVGMFAAFVGWGYWALVLQALTNSFINSCTFLILARLIPVPRWNKKVVQSIFSYSGNLTLFSILNYWARNLDNLLIGKFLGTAPLGFYNRAYQLMTLPLSMLASVISPVLHSILAERQHDISAMYRGYKKVVKTIGLVSIPGMTVSVIMAPELIRVTWGNQWEQAIPVFAILGLNGMFQPIMSTTGTVFLARNKTNWLFKSGIISTALCCSGICIGLPYGIIGVATGYTIASSLFILPLMFFIFVKLLNGKFIDFLNIIKFPFIFSLLCSPFTIAIANLLRQKISDIFVLLAVFSFCLSAYVIAIFIFDRSLFQFALNYMPFTSKKAISKLQ